MPDVYAGSQITGTQGNGGQPAPSNTVRRGDLTAQILRKLLGARANKPVHPQLRDYGRQASDGMIGGAGAP